ncbi:MAG: hypothetical protein ACD_45C00685G0002 [uncultured bacterium]|nr:MAG: hypothetical protein ACD_45C00685G0002 [uncultured bacterium]
MQARGLESKQVPINELLKFDDAQLKKYIINLNELNQLKTEYDQAISDAKTEAEILNLSRIGPLLEQAQDLKSLAAAIEASENENTTHSFIISKENEADTLLATLAQMNSQNDQNEISSASFYGTQIEDLKKNKKDIQEYISDLEDIITNMKDAIETEKKIIAQRVKKQHAEQNAAHEKQVMEEQALLLFNKLADTIGNKEHSIYKDIWKKFDALRNENDVNAQHLKLFIDNTLQPKIAEEKEKNPALKTLKVQGEQLIQFYSDNAFQVGDIESVKKLINLLKDTLLRVLNERIVKDVENFNHALIVTVQSIKDYIQTKQRTEEKLAQQSIETATRITGFLLAQHKLLGDRNKENPMSNARVFHGGPYTDISVFLDQTPLPPESNGKKVLNALTFGIFSKKREIIKEEYLNQFTLNYDLLDRLPSEEKEETNTRMKKNSR